ncbi:hypothetical protein PV328_000649 [Microctonus aethiopoides]|uniref:N(6)-L-threonylcarbamoyladenine synthase n=1 Tax=Microctonus aethiopoides TaxID=144406 RepID=A0AA39FVK2_9HYME|nr:hypothetical protein PV328_000649 [Microctonus aethiopoides]
MWPCRLCLIKRPKIRCDVDGLFKIFINHRTILRKYCNNELARPIKILGVETSCDDTGIAIVDNTGTILGESLHSQTPTHISFGGIIPPIAREFHRKNITDVCEQALKNAGLKLRDIDAIATTVKPGMSLSLMIGKNFGKYLSRIGNKPFIPIHHMEAHALTARMKEDVNFPYLVLLISGGHCLLALVESVTKFHLLGTTMDDAPGEAFDKAARRLKMHNIFEYRNKNGGVAIEMAAKKATDPLQFKFPPTMPHYRDCNFSFSGLKNSVTRQIQKLEIDFNITADEIIPDINNLCAGFQLAVAKHIASKTKRAMLFLDNENLIPNENRTLVMSGGVACNNFIAKVLGIVCNQQNYRLVRPPPQLCMDNGVMIAWNGMERWKIDAGVLRDPEEIERIDHESRAPLGDDWTSRVKEAHIQCSTIKNKDIYST